MSSGLTAGLYIAGSGLDAVNAQLAVVAQNVANASTPDYVTETLSQASIEAGGDGDGVVTGVTTRSVNLQLQQDVLAQNGTVSALATTQAALQPIDAAQGTVSGANDLSSLVANLDAAFTTLQSDPGSGVQQQAVVQSAATLASQVSTLGNAYQAARQTAQNTLVSEVGQLNTALGQVGTLSNQIIAAQAAGRSTADLANQRDTALQTIASLVSIKVLAQPNGDMMVMTASGTALPIHGNATLSLANANVGANSAAALGTTPNILLAGQNISASLTGGSIGANLTLRDTTLPTYQGELDEFAEALSTRFSAQGLTLFTDANGNVPATGGWPAQANYVGYAQSIQVNPSVLQTPSLVRDGTAAIAGSAAGATAFTPNTDATNTGFETLIDRVLNYSFGDQVQDGVTQPGLNTTGLGPTGTLSAPYGGTASLSGAASSLVGAQSQDVTNVQTDLTNEQAVQTTLTAQYASGTAVNMDQQLSTMVALQNAYGANAKILTTVQSMWSDLIATIS